MKNHDKRSNKSENKDKDNELEKNNYEQNEGSESKDLESNSCIARGKNELNDERFVEAIRVLPSTDPEVKKDIPIIPNELKLPQPPPTLLPFNSINDALNKLMGDISNYGQRLKNDYTQRSN